MNSCLSHSSPQRIRVGGFSILPDNVILLNFSNFYEYLYLFNNHKHKSLDAKI